MVMMHVSCVVGMSAVILACTHDETAVIDGPYPSKEEQGDREELEHANNDQVATYGSEAPVEDGARPW